MKRVLHLPLALALLSGCASTEKIEESVRNAVAQEKKRCDEQTSKILGPVLGEIKTFKDSTADLESQAKHSQDRIQSLMKSNKALSETSAKKGQLQRQLKELVEDKDELGRKLNDAQKAQIALQRERSDLQAKTKELADALAALRQETRRVRSDSDTRMARTRTAMETLAVAVAAESESRQAFFKQSGGSFSLTLLERVGAAMARLEDFEVSVEGHTDNAPLPKGILGGFASHWDLGTARAVAVVRYLHEKAGLNPRRITAASRGEFQPAETNGTPEGRQANRRVVLAFTPAEQE